MIVLAIQAIIAIGLFAVPLSAQGATSTTPAADAVTADEIVRHLRVLAGDSMQGRDTPSPALERAAVYVAAEFQRLGLAPGHYDGTWLQRYDIPGHVVVDRMKSGIQFLAAIRYHGKPVVDEGGGQSVTTARVGLADEARLVGNMADLNARKHTNLEFFWPVVVVAGRQTVQSVQQADLYGQSIVYVPAAGIDSLGERQIVDALARAGRSVVVLSSEDSTTFARRSAPARQRPFRLVDDYMSGRMGTSSWTAYIRPRAIHDLLAKAGIDVRAAREDVRPVIERRPGLAFELRATRDTTGGPVPTAPNVVAVLEGRDSILKREYIAFTAHLDADPRNGGEDNAAGIAGLLALARAFSQPGARPRRSVVFLATSGGAKDWWGARAFEALGANARSVVASLHLDAIDRIAGDSVVVDGLDDFSTATSPRWVGAIHPEIGLTIVEGGPVDRSLANHGAFLVRVRPSLAFHSYPSRPSGRDSGSAAPDGRAIARAVRLMFYMGHELTETASRIGWSEAGRRQLQQASDRD